MWLLSSCVSAASFRLTVRSHQVSVAVVGRVWGGEEQQGSVSLGQLGDGSQSSLYLSLFTIHPDTKAALLLLLTFLAKQHADSFHSALGSLPGDKAQELQDILGLN